jgi:hypothetical protein
MLVHQKRKPTVRRVLLSPTRFVAYQLDIVGTRRQSAIECRVARELGEYFSPASTSASINLTKQSKPSWIAARCVDGPSTAKRSVPMIPGVVIFVLPNSQRTPSEMSRSRQTQWFFLLFYKIGSATNESSTMLDIFLFIGRR